MADTIDFVAEDEIQPEEIDFQEEVAPVVRIVPPGSLNPDELLPAVRKIGGALAVGEPGDTHPDIIKRDKIPATDIDQRGFAGPQGEFYDRESAAQGTQLPTEMEPGRLHSTDLIAAPKTQFPGIKLSPYQEAEFAARQKVPTGMEPGTELTTALSEQGMKLATPILKPVEKALTYAGNVVRAIPADIAESIAGNEQYFDMLNLGAAALGETMPIDEALNEAASESKTWATVGKVSQGIAGTAPMIAAFGGLPVAAQRIALASFTAQMLKDVPEIATQLGDELGKIRSQQDPGKITDLVSQGIQSVGFGTLGAYALARGPMAIRAQEIGKAEQLRAAQMESIGRGTALAPESAQALPGMAPSVWSPEVIPVIGGAAGATAMRLPPEAVRPAETAQVAPAPSTAQIPVEGIRVEPAPSEMMIPRETPQVSPAPSTAFPVRGEGRPFVAEITPKVSDLVSRKPGETTFEEMMSVKDKDMPVLFEEFRKNNKSAQFDSPLAGEKMPVSDLPKVTAARDKAATEMLEAMKKGNMDASFAPQARMIWLNGLIEGINKKGPNYESAKRLQSEGAWEKAQAITPEFSDALQGRQIQIRRGPALSESGIWSHLREQHGIERGGAITLVNRPDAPWSGQVVRNKQGQPVGIEINRAKITDANDINWVMEHEAAHWFDLTTPGGAARILERSLEPMEWAQIDADIIAARYNPSKFGPERTAFAIQSLAERWRKRSWFGRLTGQIMRFASDTIGIKMTRAAAENAAVRAVTRGIESAKAFRGRQVERVSTLEGRTPEEERIISMGGAVAGEKPAAAQIEQLTKAMEGVQESKAPLGQQIREAFNIGQRFATAKSAIGQAVSGLKTAGDLLINKWKGVEKIDDLLRAKGRLSQQIEARGWRLRQWERAAQKAIPNRRDQAAIAKWVDAGGDRATLEKGLAESPAKFKQAYADALALKGDKLTAAQNVQNYFESRLQEAIDAGVLEHGVENYIHRMYESKPDLLKRALAYTQTGLLKTSPSLAKKRVFQFDWEAEKEGYVPVQSFIKRITSYEASLSKAIAAREFIKKASELKAPDGRPIIDIKGVGIPVEDPAGVYREATLIKPKYNPTKNNESLLPTGAPNPNYRGDYANRDYRALSRWKWVGSDAGGKPIFVQGDVAIHPDYVGKIDVLLQPSQVRYGRYGKILRPALGASSVMKQTMLDLSGFHQVQITVHAMEHRVMPWKIIKDIDLADPNVDGLLRCGVSLGGDYGGAFREGLVGSSLTRLIPGLGNAVESYHQWLFQDYIPRIKMTMALHALERNRARFGDRMSEEEIFRKTANQANAAFGELNYIMLERSKTAQDISRLILLAPDFLEARARFALQAFEKGGKRFGNEQRMALLFGALTMWITARIANKIVDGQYHNEPENLFNIVYDGHAYGLRTVQGDILHFLTKPIQFWTSRLNPVYGRTTLEALTGRDYFGRKRSFPEQAWDAVSTVIPISLRSNRERKLWESLLNGFGVTARRWSDVDDAFTLAKKWKETHGVTERGEFIYDPQKDVLRPLKLALNHGDEVGAAKEIKALIDSKAYTIKRLNSYFDRYANMPFAGSFANDKKFKATLTDDQKKTVEAARQHKIEIKKLYQKSRAQYLARPVKDVGAPEVKIDFVQETK